MSRSRCTLHKTKLMDFAAFCRSRGWSAVPVVGVYEVLRMRHPGRVDPLIVHDRDSATEHYTTWGESQTELRAWLRTRKS
jgi:hypothetical protein